MPKGRYLSCLELLGELIKLTCLVQGLNWIRLRSGATHSVNVVALHDIRGYR
jgi:hypothetical protein